MYSEKVVEDFTKYCDRALNKIDDNYNGFEGGSIKISDGHLALYKGAINLLEDQCNLDKKDSKVIQNLISLLISSGIVLGSQDFNNKNTEDKK